MLRVKPQESQTPGERPAARAMPVSMAKLPRKSHSVQQIHCGRRRSLMATAERIPKD